MSTLIEINDNLSHEIDYLHPDSTYTITKFNILRDIITVGIYNESLKTYLMLGAAQNNLYTYLNISQGYGLLNYQNIIMRISKNLS